MGSIQVDTAGLLALATLCDQQAAHFITTSSPAAAVGSVQPSALAVHTAQTEVAAASASFSARMTATAVAASSAATRYALTETSNAAEISAAGATVA